MPEQRRLGRWEIGRQAKIKLHGAYAFADCYIKDLNFKGVQFALKIKLPEDSFFRFNLSLTNDISLDIEAWVVWHQAIGPTNIYGIYFSKISDQDKEKIYNFLRRDFSRQVEQRWWQDTKKGGGLMQPEGHQDKRVFARFPVQLPVRFLDSASNQEGYAKTCDISAKGLGLISNIKLNTYRALELWLDIPDNATPLYARGEVVWSQAQNNQGYRCGINLEKADLMGLARALRAKKT